MKASKQPILAAHGRQSAVAAGFIVLFVCTGANYSFGVLFKPIINELGWNRATLAGAGSVGLFVYAFAQLFAGRLVDRFGCRRVVLPSMLLMALGTGMVAWVHKPWELTLWYGVVASLGYSGTGILPISILIHRWFPDRSSTVLAIAASGFSLGHLVFSQLASWTAVTVGWRPAYIALAALLVIFTGITALLLTDPPVTVPDRESQPAPTLTAAATSRGQIVFALISVAYCVCGFTDFVITTHLAPYAADMGFPPAVGANAISLLAAGNIFGILASGRAAQRWGVLPTLTGTYIFRGASFCLLLVAHESWQLYLFALLFGATFFTTAPLTATLIGQTFGLARQGRVFGIANMFHHLSSALGSYAGGLVFDRTQSYSAIFAGSLLLVLIAAVAQWAAGTLRNPGPKTTPIGSGAEG